MTHSFEKTKRTTVYSFKTHLNSLCYDRLNASCGGVCTGIGIRLPRPHYLFLALAGFKINISNDDTSALFWCKDVLIHSCICCGKRHEALSAPLSSTGRCPDPTYSLTMTV